MRPRAACLPPPRTAVPETRACVRHLRVRHSRWLTRQWPAAHGGHSAGDSGSEGDRTSCCSGSSDPNAAPAARPPAFPRSATAEHIRLERHSTEDASHRRHCTASGIAPSERPGCRSYGEGAGHRLLSALSAQPPAVAAQRSTAARAVRPAAGPLGVIGVWRPHPAKPLRGVVSEMECRELSGRLGTCRGPNEGI